MTLTQSFIVTLAILFGIAAVFIVTGLWKKTELGERFYRRRKKSALSDNLLRNPGQYLLDQISEDLIDFGLRSGMLFITPPVFVLVYSYLPASKQNEYTILFMLLFLVPLFIWPLFKVRKLFKRIQDNRIGYNGEVATAQELNQLMRYGYYVFHDMQAANFNIDHIVFGRGGVFAVETKTRSKENVKGAEAAKVFVNGSFLQYPTYRDTASLEQASNQAKWLSVFLTNSVGKKIVADPALSLPGWMVERRTSETPVIVLNPKESVKFFANRPALLDDQTIQQIKHQVEQKCRDVKPTSPI